MSKKKKEKKGGGKRSDYSKTSSFCHCYSIQLKKISTFFFKKHNTNRSSHNTTYREQSGVYSANLKKNTFYAWERQRMRKQEKKIEGGDFETPFFSQLFF
jgi:hypothetical protein